MQGWAVEQLQRAVDFSHVLNLSITASWLILAVLLLRLLLRKAPRWITVALWGLVAFRLLMPFSIESSFSLIPSSETVPEELLRYQGVQLQEPARLDVVDNPALYHNEVSIELEQSVDRVQWSMVKLTFPWLIGVGLMLLYAAVSYIRLRRQVRTAVRLRENIYQSENVPSPFVLGVIRPRIYLPFTMEEQSLPHVIAHEQAHIRRRDHWWKPLGFLLLSIHWFNPLMWLAYWLLCRDIELACDEKVIKELGTEDRADYSEALLRCSAGQRRISACPLAFGESDVKKRVKSVLSYKKPAFWVIAAAVLASIVVAVCFLTNPESSGKNPNAYYLRIGTEGVMSVEVSVPHGSGGAVHADGSPFIVGEEVWLERLDGMDDLRGVSITALGENGEVLYALSIPEGASDEEIVNIVSGDGWLLAPSTSSESASIGIIGGADGPTAIFVTGGHHFGVTFERDGGITGINLPNLAFHPLPDDNPTYAHNLSAGNLADLPLIPYTFPNNGDVTISYTVYSSANAPENISLTDTAIGPDGSFLYVDESGEPIGQEAKFTREKILGGERFTCTLEPSQFNLAFSSAGPHETFRCFSLRYQVEGQWMEACFVLRTAEEYVNAAAGMDVAVEPVPVPPSRTDPAKVAEAFLTQYFDKMCAGDSGLNWDEERNAWLDGLIVYNGLNRNDIHLLSQWIGYKSMLADFGYRIEEDCGRYTSLEVHEIGAPETLGSMEDTILRGYFNTTAFGAFVELGMVKKADDDYAIVSVSFPDWKEYNTFLEDFTAYMQEHGLPDYAKTGYVDSERRQRQEALQDALGINSYEWLDIVTADVDGSGERKHIIAYAKGHDGGYMDGSRPITLVSLSMDRREKEVLCTLVGWTGYEAHLASLPTPDGGADILCLSQWLGGTMEQYRIGILQKGADGSWRDTFAEYGMGLDYSIDLLSIREAHLTYILPDGRRGEAMLDPSIGYKNALNMGQIKEDGSLTERGRMNEPETYSYTFGDGFTYRLYWEDGALSLHARQYIEGFHKLDRIGYLNSLWRYKGGKWMASAEVEPASSPTETGREWELSNGIHSAGAEGIDLITFIGGTAGIDRFRLSRAVSGESSPSHTLVTDREQLNALLDILSQNTVSITEFEGSSGWSITFHLYAGDTSICSIKPVDERLFVGYDKKNYIFAYPSNISSALLEVLGK